MAAAKAQSDDSAPKAEATATTVASGKVVKYIGTSDIRKISAADWRSAGVEDQTQTVWDKSNKFSIPVADLTDAAVRYLEEDSGFVVADAEA